MTDELLRVRQAAELLGLGHSKTYELLKTGELRAIRIGRARRIPRTEITAFISRRLAEAEAGK